MVLTCHLLISPLRLLWGPILNYHICLFVLVPWCVKIHTIGLIYLYFFFEKKICPSLKVEKKTRWVFNFEIETKKYVSGIVFTPFIFCHCLVLLLDLSYSISQLCQSHRWNVKWSPRGTWDKNVYYHIHFIFKFTWST